MGTSSQQYKHNETDVAEFNVTALLSEMESGEPYHLPSEKPEEHEYPYASPLEELNPPDAKIEEVKEETQKQDQQSGGYPGSNGRRKNRREKKKAEDWPALSPGFDDVEVILLGGNLSEVLKKSKYAKLFHRAYVGTLACVAHLGLWAHLFLHRSLQSER